jgi:hypothetical protein
MHPHPALDPLEQQRPAVGAHALYIRRRHAGGRWFSDQHKGWTTSRGADQAEARPASAPLTKTDQGHRSGSSCARRQARISWGGSRSNIHSMSFCDPPRRSTALFASASIGSITGLESGDRGTPGR